MSVTKLRQQGGAVVLTIPSDIAALMGWTVGTALDIAPNADGISIKPAARVARGRKTVAELLKSIDENEIAVFNDAMSDDLASGNVGREAL
ncbi:antitoxin [Serratia sp. 14-2641]|jgi:antitoxin ChpS|uniref:AbrB/MazE/SpoVT family DNA-binding domain-containing protein n=1 Tax=Serratia sp. 14-2641 TaxID=1841657 RepID=UPI00080FB1F5|nr:antitoxin [Serratia sp. 14-2641]OCJ26504.1 antitoxin [Serratia sp. 14-2641]